MKFKILYEYQFGFREGHSTTQALAEITDRLKNVMDDKELSCGIFIDLTKAFDTVDHNNLLKKMFSYTDSTPLWQYTFLDEFHYILEKSFTLFRFYHDSLALNFLEILYFKKKIKKNIGLLKKV